MYSVVLATVLVAGSAAPDFGGKGLGCHGCYGACYGACYGVCYGGWAGSGCYGGCCGCYGGGWGYGSCYGSGWGGCGGWSSCYGGCSGCYGGCCGWSSCYGGCYGCYGGWGGYGLGSMTYSNRMGIYSAPGVFPPTVIGPSSAAPVLGPIPMMPPAPVFPGYSIAPSNGYTIVPNNAVPMGEVSGPVNGQVSTKQPAQVVIKAATDVKVLFNGKTTNRKKAEETFKTPDLMPGQLYAYDVVAEVSRDGKTYTASKKITVRAGERSEVSFGDASEVIAAAQADSAHITVLLPEGGKLYVDGQERGTNAAKQTFDTPKLVKGKTYYYTLKVEVKASNNAGAKTQRVNVEAGKDVTVDFRSMFESAE